MDQFVIIHSHPDKEPVQLSFHNTLDDAREEAERWWKKNGAGQDEGEVLTIFRMPGPASAVGVYRGFWV